MLYLQMLNAFSFIYHDDYARFFFHNFEMLLNYLCVVDDFALVMRANAA